MKGEVFNLGLSNANLTKLELANKIKKYIPHLKLLKYLTEKIQIREITSYQIKKLKVWVLKQRLI